MFKKKYTDEDISKNYEVKYLLRGDVQGTEGAFRITMQMTDLQSRVVLWSKLFDFGELKQLFPVQEKIV